ncbi:MAG TPA: alpha/beta fold hydrolase, partial [Ktedonobacterales bacterium]|nr:alpha/beta fold hydrolase [Ktedonobacterales bacterium]
APGTRGRWLSRLLVALLAISGLLSLSYAGISTYIATKLVYRAQTPVTGTPARYGLNYAYVTFPARDDGLQIKGWFIPGVLRDGRLTADRTLLVVHGTWKNRADPDAGVLELSAALAHRGYAVLAFDLRGHGESAPAPLSMGMLEQRDILGAVDYLQRGRLPYPELRRPRVIAGWGVSLGGASLLFAAAREPAIRAVVSDCAYADVTPIFEREIPMRGGLPPLFTPGAFVMGRVLYDVDYYAARPVDVIARIAPRPILLIHGSADDYIPPSNMDQLYAAASAAPGAHAQQWLVPGAKHAQSFHTVGAQYVDRIAAFYTAALGSDQNAQR